MQYALQAQGIPWAFLYLFHPIYLLVFSLRLVWETKGIFIYTTKILPFTTKNDLGIP